MNVFFFIGNGFDLNNGLNSRLKDVLLRYIDETSNHDPIIESFKKSINQDINTWAKFEEKMGEYTDKINKKETPIETFLDYMKCMLDFKKFLKNYLKNEESKIKYDNPQNIAKIFKNSIFNFKECLDQDQKIVTDIIDKDIIKFSYINFNYTTVFDNYLDIFKKSNIYSLEKKVRNGVFCFTKFNDLGTVIHIHGTLDDSMILGVNELNQIANISFHGLERLNLYIKPEANDGLGNHKNTDVIKLLQDADIICIFGMSLGKTDRKWWLEIGKQLNNSPNKHLIIYAHSADYDASFPEYTYEEKDVIRNNFLKHLQFSKLNKNDIEKIRENIHVAINKDVFKF